MEILILTFEFWTILKATWHTHMNINFITGMEILVKSSKMYIFVSKDHDNFVGIVK